MGMLLDKRVLIIALLSCFVFPTNGEAQNASGKSGPGGLFAVRVNPIDVPVLKSGIRETDILTVFIVARSKLAVKTVCYYMPRIKDALIQDFDGDPLTQRAFKRLHLGGADKRIYKAIRKAMKRSKSIKRVHAIAGARTPRKAIPWFKSLKIEICKVKKKEDKKKSGKKH